MNSKKWNINESQIELQDRIKSISESLGISRLVATLLVNRGMDTPKAALGFIRLSDTLLHDAYLIPDMEKAVDRIYESVNKKEKIVIYGDYDVDGVTSVSILMLYFKECGVSADYYIPDRKGEGYGVNVSAIEQFARDGVTLMITVDTGVTAVEETEYAKSLGIDVVITDHHECHAILPSASAVVNPRRHDSSYPFKELAGVGVVFKLVSALTERKYKLDESLAGENYLKEVVDKYIDLVAMGTIADVMPLVDENRLFVSLGLRKMNRDTRLGLSSLLVAAQSNNDPSRQQKKISVTSSTISYTVAPRINAAGRIDNAGKAVELFLTENEEKACTIAEELCHINRARQTEENRIIEEVEKKIEREFDPENDKVIVLDDSNWHHGVIGIVASRITEKYGTPSILISFEGDIGKGSGRSIKGINLVEALSAASDYLVKFGGHELAAGLTVERGSLEGFKRAINDYVKSLPEELIEGASIDADALITAEDITVENAESLELLEPYGVANPTPLFVIKNLVIADIMLLGQKHTRLLLRDPHSGARITALRFGIPRSGLEYYVSDKVDVLASLSVNEFRDQKTAQLIIKDIRLSDGNIISDSERARYKEIITGAAHRREEELLPTRDDISLVYLYVKRRVGTTRDEYMGIRELLSSLCAKKINYVKLRLILDILVESGVLTAQYSGENLENVKFGVNFVKSKVDIEKSPTYIRVKSSLHKG